MLNHIQMLHKIGKRDEIMNNNNIYISSFNTDNITDGGSNWRIIVDNKNKMKDIWK